MHFAPALAPATRVLILADHAVGTGLGHVARCLSLANALAAQGMQVALATQELPRFLAPEGCELLVHPSELADLLSWEPLERADVLVIDSYLFPEGWRRALRRPGQDLVFLDDERGQWLDGADVVINPSPLAQAASYALRAPHAQALLGPSYALVGPTFVAPPLAWHQREERVLLSFGGADPLGLTEPTTQALLACLPAGVELDVVLPTQREAHVPAHPRVYLHHRLPHLAGLMLRARLALTQVGGILGELAASATPAVAAVTGAEQGAWLLPHPQLAWCRRVDGRPATGTASALAKGLAEAAQDLWQSPVQLQALSQLARATVDGLGAQRVAGELQARVLAAPVLEGHAS